MGCVGCGLWVEGCMYGEVGRGGEGMVGMNGMNGMCVCVCVCVGYLNTGFSVHVYGADFCNYDG